VGETTKVFAARTLSLGRYVQYDVFVKQIHAGHVYIPTALL